jgi:anti-sigma factor RsiW
MLDCTEFWTLLSAYLDGDLSTEVRIEFEEHMATCEDARALFRTFEQTITLHRRVSFVEDVPEEVRRRLSAALEACIQARRDGTDDTA